MNTENNYVDPSFAMRDHILAVAAVTRRSAAVAKDPKRREFLLARAEKAEQDAERPSFSSYNPQRTRNHES